MEKANTGRPPHEVSEISLKDPRLTIGVLRLLKLAHLDRESQRAGDMYVSRGGAPMRQEPLLIQTVTLDQQPMHRHWLTTGWSSSTQEQAAAEEPVLRHRGGEEDPSRSLCPGMVKGRPPFATLIATIKMGDDAQQWFDIGITHTPGR